MKIQNFIFQGGGLLLVAGAIMPMIPQIAHFAALCFSIGALCFGGMQLLQRYDGGNLIIVSAALMMLPQHFPEILRGDEWKVTLIVAAVLEVYTAFRIPHEMDKSE